jgi:predicted dehydrogenase
MAWACDLKEELIAKARAHHPSVRYTTDMQEVLADPSLELVLIATPTQTHVPLATRALEAGKHVFVEKPLAPTAHEAEQLVREAARQKRLLFVDHTFVFAPSVAKMREVARQGSLGTPLYFDSVRINLGIIQQDTSVLYDLAIHDLSILNVLKDLAGVSHVAAHGHKHVGKQTEDAHVHLNFHDGFHAHIHVSWLSPVKIRRTILAGSNAMIVYDDTEVSEKIRIYDRGIVQDLHKPSPFLPAYRMGDVLIPSLPAVETLAIEAHHVLRCIRGEEKPLAPGSDAVSMLQILERATASINQGGSLLPL